MRASGRTYLEIRKKLGVPKSTLSTWFNKKYPVDRTKQIEHLKRIRPFALAKVQARIAHRDRVISDKVIREIDQHENNNIFFKKSLLAMLYWAEGAKSEKMGGLKFANTDPEMMRLFMRLFRECFAPDESRFHASLHLHYYHGKKKSIHFWSEVLGISPKQFWKTYSKARSRKKRFRRNFMGICFLYYYDSRVRIELLEIGRKLCEHFKKVPLVPSFNG